MTQQLRQAAAKAEEAILALAGLKAAEGGALPMEAAESALEALRAARAKKPMPEGAPPEAQEAWDEFCAGQEIMQLLVDSKLGRVRGAMVLGFVMARCIEQIDHPLVAQQAFMMIGDTVNGRIERYIEWLAHDPATRVRATAGTAITQKLAMKASARESLVHNIPDEVFKIKITPPETAQQEEPPSNIILAK